jgi:hypothetical protein
MQTKICSKCGRELPLSEFHRYNRRGETHYSQCKQCKAEYKHRNKDKLLIAQKKRRANDDSLPEKQRAWNKVHYALKTGKIHKPENCSVCGKLVGKDKIQAHHNNYNKPFDIIWCCQDCHVMLDKKRKHAKRMVSEYAEKKSIC